MKSEIKVDKDGVWYFRGARMFRKEFLAIFFENLKVDENGHYLIELGDERCYLDVEDTVFVVQAVSKVFSQEEGEAFYILLNDDTVEKLDVSTLQIGRDHVPYCFVKNGKFKARFSRKSYYQLAEYIEASETSEKYFINVNGKRYYIPMNHSA